MEPVDVWQSGSFEIRTDGSYDVTFSLGGSQRDPAQSVVERPRVGTGSVCFDAFGDDITECDRGPGHSHG
jgi:hypothetical protein